MTNDEAYEHIRNWLATHPLPKPSIEDRKQCQQARLQAQLEAMLAAPEVFAFLHNWTPTQFRRNLKRICNALERAKRVRTIL